MIDIIEKSLIYCKLW